MSDKENSVREAKHFLAEVLVELIRDYPMSKYLLQIDQEREDMQTWLESILSGIVEGWLVDSLVENVLQSDRILHTLDLMKRRPKKKKKKRPS